MTVAVISLIIAIVLMVVITVVRNNRKNPQKGAIDIKADYQVAYANTYKFAKDRVVTLEMPTDNQTMEPHRDPWFGMTLNCVHDYTILAEKYQERQNTYVQEEVPMEDRPKNWQYLPFGRWPKKEVIK